MSLTPLNLRVFVPRKDKDSGLILALCHADVRKHLTRFRTLVIPVMSLAPLNLRVLVPRKDKQDVFVLRFVMLTKEASHYVSFIS
jgi:hypothetical protein